MSNLVAKEKRRRAFFGVGPDVITDDEERRLEDLDTAEIFANATGANAGRRRSCERLRLASCELLRLCLF